MRPQLTVLLLTPTGWRWLKSAGVLPVVWLAKRASGMDSSADRTADTQHNAYRENLVGKRCSGYTEHTTERGGAAKRTSRASGYSERPRGAGAKGCNPLFSVVTR